MKYAGIYGITDDKLLSADRMLLATEAAMAAGLCMLQYRSKTGTTRSRLETARELQALSASYRIPLIINDDVDLCLAAGAAGVHLGRQDEDISSARSRLGPQAIIGVTCHASLDHAVRAEQQGADYVAFGRFFPSHTKPDAAPAPLSLLTAARATLSLPIVAIGGINAENGAAVLEAGADMLAIIHDIFAADDVAARTRVLVALCKKPGTDQTDTG